MKDAQPAPFESYVDFFSGSSMSSFRHKTRIGGRRPIRMLQITQPAHEDEDAATEELLIGLVLGGTAAARWSWGGRGKWCQTNARRAGDIGISPVRTTGHFQVDGPSRMLVIGIPLQSFRDPSLSGSTLEFGSLHDHYAQIPKAARLSHAMWRASAHQGSVADCLIEEHAAELIEVLKSYARPAPVTPSPRTLSEKDMRIIADRVAAIGPENLTVSDLAAGLAMSVKSFRLRFRATSGMRPHAYLIAKRLELAQRRLEETHQPIVDIAMELGFSSQAHLTMAFARHTGVSPALYRRARQT